MVGLATHRLGRPHQDAWDGKETEINLSPDNGIQVSQEKGDKKNSRRRNGVHGASKTFHDFIGPQHSRDRWRNVFL